jgi:bifunctional non-homologous end joining protein LigD
MKKPPKLTEYRRKRDFTRTAEPRGTARRKARALAYVIQKHAASRLHYDLRLELDGVMKSWAVPKGPSLDPAVKRLAMQVEDHPIEYNTFEGLRKGYAKGDLKVVLKGKRLKGSWVLVRIRRGDPKRAQWLLIKHRDAAAEPGTEVVEEYQTSVATGRTMDEIAAGRTPRARKAARA